MAKKKPTKMLAVLGRSRRGGRWSVAEQSSVLACLGTCNLDMRRSSVDGEAFKMKVTVFLGSATFVLPPGASVKPSGMTLLAGSLVDVPETDEVCELPTLEIEWSTVLGRIRVVTRSLDDEDETVDETDDETDDKAVVDTVEGRHRTDEDRADEDRADGTAESTAVGFGGRVLGKSVETGVETTVGTGLDGVAIAPSVEVQQHADTRADELEQGRRRHDAEAGPPTGTGTVGDDTDGTATDGTDTDELDNADGTDTDQAPITTAPVTDANTEPAVDTEPAADVEVKVDQESPVG